MSNGLKAQVATLPESRRAALTEYVVRMLAGAGIHAGAGAFRVRCTLHQSTRVVPWGTRGSMGYPRIASCLTASSTA